MNEASHPLVRPLLSVPICCKAQVRLHHSLRVWEGEELKQTGSRPLHYNAVCRLRASEGEKRKKKSKGAHSPSVTVHW